MTTKNQIAPVIHLGRDDSRWFFMVEPAKEVKVHALPFPASIPNDDIAAIIRGLNPDIHIIIHEF